MRVALLSGNAPRHNAIGNQIAEKARFFQERGAEVRLFVEDARRLHPDLLDFIVEMPTAIAHGPEWDYLRHADLIIAVYAQYFDLLRYLPRLFGSGPRIVFDYHGVTPAEYGRNQQREGLEKSARQRGYVWCADHALTTSDANARELKAATDFPRQHLTTLPLPVDLNRFRPALDDQFLRHTLGIDGRILLYVGRLAANKRVSHLIEALARLNDPLAHVVIVGDCGDVYAEEAARCQELAQQLGVAQRVHWLGQLGDADLTRAYCSADVLVMPSLHEGFCVPVIEAMACGLPVIASRSTALPETVGDAGLTFTPDDVDDLVRQLRRVTEAEAPSRATAGLRRVAFVSFRFGPEIVGGAETSLRTMARALQSGGHHVEIFTTCATTESHWANHLAPGNVTLDGLLVRRFPIDAHDAAAHGEIVRTILDADGRVVAEAEERYLRLSIHSAALMEALRQRQSEFDAIITGPYLFGLSADVAREFPHKTLIVPCFHDEPIARLNVWPRLYGNVGGILYHSLEEQAYAQARLGVNHPNARQIGTWLPRRDETLPSYSPNKNRRPYVVYCGRYSEQKNLPLLIAWAERYQAEHPGRLDFVFLGQGDVTLPTSPWLYDLGRVDEPSKQSVLASAVALVQLSTQESLSLVVLEAWAAGTPVVVHRECAVLAGQVQRAQGGRAVAAYAEFAHALDELTGDAAKRRALGTSGRDYVDKNYASAEKYVSTLIAAIDALRKPIAQQMRERGLERAERFARPAWQRRFAEFVETVLTQPPRPCRDELVIAPLRPTVHASAGTRTLLLPVRLAQRGTVASASDGPGATVICSEIHDDNNCPVGARSEIRLPCLMTPGRPQAAALPIELPAELGSYRLMLWTENAGGERTTPVEIALTVAVNAGDTRTTCAAALLDTVRETLPKAHQLQQLPANYVDVTEGALAPVKRLIKQRLLNNFKHAYVDVLSRQQSQVNGHLVLMIQQLTECCAMLDHAVAGLSQRLDVLEAKLEQSSSTPNPGFAEIIDT